jgi:hypothetical protein
MPLFSLLFFILCLANSGTPLTFNFIGEFLSLYGAFERLPVLGILASSSIVLSAAFTIFLYNRVAFGGSLSSYFTEYVLDLNKREFVILIALIVPTVLFGIYPSAILDGLHYSASTLIYPSSEISDLSLAFIPCAFCKLPKRFNSTQNKPLSCKTQNLDPNFVTGFTDAKGCFSIGVYTSNKYQTGYQVQAIFQISLHDKDLELLSKFQSYFGAGNIKKHGKYYLFSNHIFKRFKSSNLSF